MVGFMRIKRIKIFMYLAGIFVAFTYGVITAQYKIFPYKEVREIKKFVASNAHAQTNKILKPKSSISNYYLNKISFFEEHAREVEVLMLGDSITDHAEWSDLFPSVEITNHGIGGDTVEGVRNRLELIYGMNVSKVFIMIGINNISTKTRTVDIYKNYKEIVNDLIKNKIQVYIQSILLVGKENNKSHLNTKIKTLNYALSNFSNSNELITYIDLNETLSDGSYLKNEYSIDGMHLNGKAYKIWRDIIRPYIL